ncbi:MAG: hypothetical protein ABIG28_02680 [archaeon]
MVFKFLGARVEEAPRDKHPGRVRDFRGGEPYPEDKGPSQIESTLFFLAKHNYSVSIPALAEEVGLDEGITYQCLRTLARSGQIRCVEDRNYEVTKSGGDALNGILGQ